MVTMRSPARGLNVYVLTTTVCCFARPLIFWHRRLPGAAPRQIPSGFRGEVLSVAPPWIPGLSGTALVEDRDSVVCARSSQRPSGVFVANDDFLFSLGATTRR